MSGAIETVEAFLARWGDPDDVESAFREYFTDATVWENVGVVTTTGIEQALGFNAAFEASMGMKSVKVDMLAIAQVGGKVLTERIDHIIDASGNTVVSIRIMGIFEIENGKIAAWRDYFDSAGLRAQT